ncbi:hypothetical protein amrb99_98170 [Actinomadura sp. RB99]|nr:hypothetical protein [Actinomadura sp. RB99]
MVSVATQHRIMATLRTAYNKLVKGPYPLSWNPVHAVISEMPPETRGPATVWGPEEVQNFLVKSVDDPYHVIYRLVLLRGPRRGEVLGLRWRDLDLSGPAATATVRQTLLNQSGVYFDVPKTAAGWRVISLDKVTADLFRERKQRAMALAASRGEEWDENVLIFTRADGRYINPDWVGKKFRILAARYGLPVIRLHDARHTAATLGLEAGLAVKVVSEQLGHSTTRITEDLYMSVRRVVANAAAEQIATFVKGADGVWHRPGDAAPGQAVVLRPRPQKVRRWSQRGDAGHGAVPTRPTR